MIHTDKSNEPSIFVFKSSITTKTKVKQFSKFIKKEEIIKWNVDLEDCDKVLRIVTAKRSVDDILNMAKINGFVLSELV